MLRKPIVLIMLTFAILTACSDATPITIETIRGSGNVITQERPIGSISGVQINLGADLALTQGEGNSLSIEADDNLLEYIQADVRNGRLVISTPDDISLAPSRTIRLHVGFDALNAIEIFGSSTITADNLELNELSIHFSGSGSTRLRGQIPKQHISITGNATIHNFDVASSDVTVDISGAGTVEVNAAELLSVTVKGMGIVRYSGSPAITQSVSGTATIAER